MARKLLNRELVDPRSATEALSLASATYQAWKTGAERRAANADAILLRDAAGDPLAEEFHVAWCRSPRFDFLLRFDPEEREPLTLGRFVPLELGEHAKDVEARLARREQRKGRETTFRVEDLGEWDTWISTVPRTTDGEPIPYGPGFEPQRYTIDATVLADLETLRATARIDLTVSRKDLRALRFEIHPDLKVRAVRDGAGKELAFHQDRVVTVLLPEAPSGATATVAIEYGGAALVKSEWQLTQLRSTQFWYPHGGLVDRARYDVTMRWPKKVDCIASGAEAESGADGDTRWQRRTLDTPAIAFSFELGNYDYLREQVGHVAVTFAFVKSDWSPKEAIRDEVRAAVAEALAFFETSFGPYPLDYLTVVSVPPRGFAQGFLGFLTLDGSLLVEPKGWILVRHPGLDAKTDVANFRRRIVVHELAHQWWGNLMGWESDRDQWLSEALAEYAALLYESHREGKKAIGLALWASGRKETLSRGAANGITIESLGPVTLGSRLDSSLSDSAYQAIVYDKGALVFSMLARTVGEKPFTEMLRTIAQKAANRSIDTRTFLRAIEKMSGKDLRAFSETFVYGTGLPELFYTREFVSDAGAWKVRGHVREIAPWSSRYALEKSGKTWRLVRTFEAGEPVRDLEWAVPFQVAVGAAEGASARDRTQQGLGGIVRFHGGEDDFEITLPKEPVGFWLDQRSELPATFHSEATVPKETLREMGDRLTGHGDGTAAEQAFRKALAAELWAGGPPPGSRLSKQDEERIAIREDTRIHLALGDLLLDRGRDAEARKELEAAEELLRGPDSNLYSSWRTESWTRLELLEGDSSSAYDRLSELLYLHFVQRADESTPEQLRRMKFSRGQVRGGDAYAMLAVAAHDTGHEPVCELARKEARLQNVDLGPLEELHRAASR